MGLWLWVIVAITNNEFVPDMIHYDAIYLSPHLDDAALSCGGQIFSRTQRGENILIVTLMAGNPGPGKKQSQFAQILHERWQLLQDVVAQRRAEDVAACSVLGADYQHGTVPDCIYRVHPETNEPFYATRAAIFGEIHSLEMALVARLADNLADLPPHDQLFVPLTVGNHVDHQLTRLAAETWAARSSTRDTLWYYEDYPYVLTPDALATVLPPGAPDWMSKVITLAEPAVSAKIDAIAAFASQVSTFFNGRLDLEQQIHHFTQQVGGERIWQRQTAA